MSPNDDARGARSPRSSRGSALVLALFVLVLVVGMGVALLFVGQNELRMSKANNEIKRAFYFAESGVEDGRRTLYDANGQGSFDDDLATAAGPNGTLDLDPTALRPIYDAKGVVTGFSGAGDDVPVRGLTRLDDGFYAAYLCNDPLEKKKRGDLDDTNERVMMVGVGVGPRGSVEVNEAVLEPLPLIPDLPGAALSLLGPDPAFQGGSSNSSRYEGRDCGGSGIPGYYVAAVGAFGSDAESDAESGVWTPNGPDYTSDPAITDPLDTVADLTDVSDPLVHAPPHPVWSNCKQLMELIENLRSRATHLCVGAGCRLPGGLTMTSVTFIDNGRPGGGDFNLGAADPDGKGVLVVTGRLRMTGARSWQGIVLVIGRGQVERVGAGNGAVSGTMIVADVAGPDGFYKTGDDCKNGLESASFQVTGGGVSKTTFCSKDIALANPAETYKVVEFRQH